MGTWEKIQVSSDIVSWHDIERLSRINSREPSTSNGLSLSEYQESIDRIADVVCTDLHGNIVYANDAFLNLNKCKLEDIYGKKNSIFSSGIHGKEFYDELWNAVNSGEVWRGEVCNRAMDGSLYWVDMQIAPRYDSDSKKVGYLALRLDITGRKEAELRAAEELERRRGIETLLNDIIETLPSGVMALDANGQLLFSNKYYNDYHNHDNLIAEQDLSNSKEEEKDASDVKKSCDSAPASDDYAEDNLCFVRHLPNNRWVQVQNRRSETGTLVSVQTDVTDLKLAEQKIRFQAACDPLTGIFNRNAFVECLTNVMSQKRKVDRKCALVRIDLDDFKAVNDGLGHDAGDALLCQVADRLKSSVRNTDTVARIGGDEFAILLPNCHDPFDIRQVMEKLISALSLPVKLGSQRVLQTASMGVATFPQDAETPSELMKCADLALYQCKRQERGGYKLYNLAMQRQRMRRLHLTEKLKQALAQGDFAVVLQPQCDMQDGCHTGFEALVRWKDEGRWIPPEDIISVAEEAGLISQVSQQIMEKAFAIFARLKDADLNPGTLAINIVAAQLHEPRFAKSLINMLNSYNIKSSELEIEITENVILGRSARSIARVLKRLHQEGIAITLDDFGMGYASLTHLKHLPLSRIKIDRSFINGMMENQDDHVIIRTIISLAQNLGLQVVAEGVETPKQYKELTGLGCDFAQGYLIGRPFDERSAAHHCEHHDLTNIIGADLFGNSR